MRAPTEEFLVFGSTVPLVVCSAHFAEASSPRPTTDRHWQTVDDIDVLPGQHLSQRQQYPLQPVTQLVQPAIEARDAYIP
jgi:hypothetical protein